MQQDAPAADVLKLPLRPPLLFEELQDLPDVLLARDYSRVDDRLLDLLGLRWIRELGRIIDRHDLAIELCNPIPHTRSRRDQVDLELALQPFLHDLQMQQAQEPAPESESQRHRILRLEVECSVIQPQLLQGRSEEH